MPSSSQITLGQVLNDAMDARDRRLAVSLPGTVVSYSSATKMASVRPGVNRLVPSEADPDVLVSESLPVIQGVPVAWPQGANFSIEGTLSAGDPVLLIAMDRDIDGWLATGKAADPEDSRMHSWASAVAIPGLKATGSFGTPSDAAALASVVDAALRPLTAAVTPALAASTAPTQAEFNALVTAFLILLNAVKSAYPGGTPGTPSTATCASNILLVDS